MNRAFKISGTPGNSPRTLCEGNWPGLKLLIKEQDISGGTAWSLTGSSHSVVVHLEGAIHQLETELAGAGATFDPPMAGEVWVVPAGVRYASQARGGRVRYAELFLDPSDHPIRARAGHYDGFLRRSVARLERLLAAGNDTAAMAASAASRAVVTHFHERYTEQGREARRRRGPRELNEHARRNVAVYIADRLGTTLSLDGMAAVAGLNSDAFLSAFRGSFGTTPAQYVIEQRLRRARWMLLSTTRDITSIALETGFASHAHLAAAFHARVGIAPRDFRAIR